MPGKRNVFLIFRDFFKKLNFIAYFFKKIFDKFSQIINMFRTQQPFLDNVISGFLMQLLLLNLHEYFRKFCKRNKIQYFSHQRAVKKKKKKLAMLRASKFYEKTYLISI